MVRIPRAYGSLQLAVGFRVYVFGHCGFGLVTTTVGLHSRRVTFLKIEKYGCVHAWTDGWMSGWVMVSGGGGLRCLS